MGIGDRARKITQDTFSTSEMGTGWRRVELPKSHSCIRKIRASTDGEVGDTANESLIRECQFVVRDVRASIWREWRKITGMMVERNS